MQKFEMEKQKISYEISGESHVCFSEIGISTENQVSNITEKRENERENFLLKFVSPCAILNSNMG